MFIQFILFILSICLPQPFYSFFFRKKKYFPKKHETIFFQKSQFFSREFLPKTFKNLTNMSIPITLPQTSNQPTHNETEQSSQQPQNPPNTNENVSKTSKTQTQPPQPETSYQIQRENSQTFAQTNLAFQTFDFCCFSTF